jgi:superfamily II DNA or RNA helicase
MPRTVRRWPPPHAPAIVAESLVAVGHPLRTALRAGPPGDARDVVRALARGIALPAAPDPPPAWLLPTQHHAYARALAALRVHRGALLAETTGAGKTWIALAVAQRWQRSPVACVVPAALVTQWHATARRLGIPIVTASHEQVSRGRLPAGTRGLVLVDESHHFRHPEIRRYGHLADFLVGRPALLISATPVVNRAEDLAHQLRLTVRDDALAREGLRSLADSLTESPAPLGSVVIATGAARRSIPVRSVSTIRARLGARTREVLRQIEALALSRDAPVAGLIRGVLWRCLASSPAALAGALWRYRLLLSHAADACDGGCSLPRTTIRQWVGQTADQLVLWSLVPESPDGSDLALDDVPRLEPLIALAERAADGPDDKLDRLRTLLADGRRTLVFTGARATVAYLRRRLGGNPGWCTGDSAGIGAMRISRGSLLAAFGAGSGGPHVLIATDVAAEGLDLQMAERVVHYDLPWTATRLEQREGRAARLGSRHAVVSVVSFEPPPALERRLRQTDALARTARAPTAVGLGRDDLWQWREIVAARYGGEPALEGVAAIESPGSGLLAGIALEYDEHRNSGVSVLLWLDGGGAVRTEPEWIAARLDEASRAAACPVNPGALETALDRLTPPVADLLRRSHQTEWHSGAPVAPVHALIRRLGVASGMAARRRDHRTLAELERALAILSGGLTAGEARLVAALARAGDGEILPALGRLPRSVRSPAPVAPRLFGLILFGPR